MGRAQQGILASQQTAATRKCAPTDIILSTQQQAVLEALRSGSEGSAPASYLRSSTGLKPAAINRIFLELEARGLVQRYFNAHGPQTPWWWQVAAQAPKNYVPPKITPGEIWDWGRREDKTWLEVKTGTNEFGMIRVMVIAGEHNQVDTVIPPHYFGRQLHLRYRGEISEWSSHFLCPVHGLCTIEMVRTDKTCALCRTGLNRI